MKRFLALFIILSILISLNGCTAFRRNDRTNYNNGIDNNSIDYTSPGTIRDPNTTTTIPQGTPLGTTSDTPYATSIRDLDGTLRRSISDLDKVKIDAKSKDYLVKQAEYYTKKANAYKAALNSINKLNYTDNYRNDHNALVSYYQNGYDTYNSLAAKYKGFKTVNEERAYRTGEGRNAYDFIPEVNNAYTRSLDSLGIRY